MFTFNRACAPLKTRKSLYRKSYLTITFCCLIFVLVSAEPVSSSLTNDRVNISFTNGPMRQVFVGAGVELPGAGPLLGAAGQSPRWDVDLDSSFIRIKFVDHATYGAGAFFAFNDLDPVLNGRAENIVGISIVTSKPTAQLDIAAVSSFTVDSIRVLISPSTTSLDWMAGEYIEVHLRFDYETSADEGGDWLSDVFKPNANFYSIQAKAEAYFQKHPELIRERDPSWVSFQRFQWFWRDRVNAPNSNKSGSFKYATNAILEFLEQPEAVCSGASSVSSNWRSLGPFKTPTAVPGTGISNTGVGIVTFVLVDPSDATMKTIYIGTNASGLWKTSDGGQTWNSLTEASRFPGMGVQSIVIPPGSPKTIYIATGHSTYGRSYGLGVLKSTNGGVSWNSTGLSFTPAQNVVVKRLLAHPSNPNILYALAGDKVYKTTDGGAGWELSLTANWDSTIFLDIEMKPGDPNTIYVASAVSGVGLAEFWRTTDGAANPQTSWRDLTPWLLSFNNPPQISPVERIAISVTPAAPNNVYALYRINEGALLLKRSEDGGITWSRFIISPRSRGTMSPKNDGGFHKLELAVSPVDANVIYTAGIQAYKSTNAGITFKEISTKLFTSPQFMHDDVRYLIVQQGSVGGGSDVLFTGNDGGVSKSIDGGQSWTSLNNSFLAITQFYGIGGTPTNAELIVGGTQDLGSLIYNGGQWSNTSALYGDGAESVIDYADPRTMYVSSNSAPYRSDDGGESWGPLFPNVQNFSTVLGSPLMQLDPNTHTTLYAAWHDVYKSTNRGEPFSWTRISNQNTDVIRALAVAPSNPNYIYFAEEGTLWDDDPVGSVGVIWRSTNGGATWTDISPGLDALMWAGITDIEVDPANPERIWVSFNGFWNEHRVVYSPNGGNTWEKFSQGLPGFPVNTLIYQKGTNDVLYAGTDVGVFRWNAVAGRWECWSNNLPVAIVTDFEINYCAGKIRAGTFGRGLWEADLPDAPSPTGCPCTPPPGNLVLWLPLDELSGPVAANAAGGSNGAHVGFLQVNNGYVAQSLSFDGANSYVNVTSYPALEVGTGDFTVDAWIRRGGQVSGEPAVRVIVDKRQEQAFGSQVRGYSLYLFNHRLGFQLADGTHTNYDSGVLIPSDNQWHHVAVTIGRNATDGGKFYLDGQQVGSAFNTRLHNGSLSSTAPLRVGSRSSTVSGIFLGSIDEVEVFRRALAPEEIRAISNAKSSGKCKHFCQLRKDTSFCTSGVSITETAQVCNSTGTAQTYEYSFEGLPSGSGCSVNGPTSFTPSSGTVTVQPGQCAPVQVTLGRPATLGPNTTACYQMIVRKALTNESFSCQGSVRQGLDLCISFPVDRNRTFALKQNVLHTITVTNTGSKAEFKYQLVVLRGDGTRDRSVMSLNGQPPGVPVTGTLSLQPGQSKTVEVRAAFVEPQPLQFFTLSMQADVDGDGTQETLASTQLLNVIPRTDMPTENAFRLKRGMNEFSILGGGSFTSPTLIGTVTDSRLALLWLRYGRIIASNRTMALAYTFDAVPLFVNSSPDFDVTRIDREPFSFRVEKVRRTVYGVGLSPLGFQLSFRPESGIRPFVNASAGFLSFNKHVPKFSSARFNPAPDFGNQGQFFGFPPRLNCVNFNPAFDFGAGIQLSTRSRRAFTIGYKYHHFSNANRTANNPGYDAHIFYTGYSLFR